MKVFGVSMIRNEADLVESWVRYHAQILDGLIVAVHQSVDGTSEILANLEREGLPVRAVSVRGVRYDQAAEITELARTAFESGADWVFPLDGDEFLNVRGVAITQTIADLDGSAPIAIPWQTYVPSGDDRADVSNPLVRIQWRLREESRPYDKVAIPGEVIGNDEISVGKGSHILLRAGVEVQSAAAPPSWAVAHFPVRSVEQLTRKVLVGWISSLSDPNRGPRTSYQWRKWFHYLIEHDQSHVDPGWLAMAYLDEEIGDETEVPLVHDPLPADLCDFELKYAEQRVVSPIKALALAAESQALELAELRRLLD